MPQDLSPKTFSSFGEYMKSRRESLGKSLRGTSIELDMTPAYLSDIEKDNRYPPEKYLAKIVEVLKVPAEHEYDFYDLAGKSRNGHYPDLTEYIGKTAIARVALRRARDNDIPTQQWQKFIDEIDKKPEN